MTKDQLVRYLRVCADLADSPKDGIAHVAIVPLRQVIQLLESSPEPSGERLTHVEHRLVRAEAEILRLGAKALDTEYMKEFPEPYIPGSPLNRGAEHG